MHIIKFFSVANTYRSRGRLRLICALVFRARTEVYECCDKTGYYYHILLSYHRMCVCVGGGGVSLENTGEGGGGGLTVI